MKRLIAFTENGGFWKRFLKFGSFTCEWNCLDMKGFAPGLALKDGRKVTQKSHILLLPKPGIWSNYYETKSRTVTLRAQNISLNGHLLLSRSLISVEHSLKIHWAVLLWDKQSGPPTKHWWMSRWIATPPITEDRREFIFLLDEYIPMVLSVSLLKRVHFLVSET